MLMAVVFITVAQVFIMKLKQIYHLLQKGHNLQNHQNKLNLCLCNFQKQHIDTLLMILRINKKFGPPFCYFLMLNCPLNAVVVSTMILGRIPVKYLLYTVTLALQQLTCNLGKN